MISVTSKTTVNISFALTVTEARALKYTLMMVTNIFRHNTGRGEFSSENLSTMSDSITDALGTIGLNFSDDLLDCTKAVIKNNNVNPS